MANALPAAMPELVGNMCRSDRCGHDRISELEQEQHYHVTFEGGVDSLPLEISYNAIPNS